MELEDGAAAPDEDPKRPATRSATTATKPDVARRWLDAVTCGGRRGEQRRPEHMARVRQLTTWTRRSVAAAWRQSAALEPAWSERSGL
jgi:hypothetical protein